MPRQIAIGLVLVCLALWPVHGYTQASIWKSHMAAGAKAYSQGNYPEIETHRGAALEAVQRFGPEDPRTSRHHARGPVTCVPMCAKNLAP